MRNTADKILEMIDNGLLDARTVSLACLKYMSEDEVADMAVANEFIEPEEDFDPTEDNDFDPDGRRAEMPWGYGEHFDFPDDTLCIELLPTTVIVRKDDLDCWDTLDDEEKEEVLNDYLSDTFGFLHTSYSYEEDAAEIRITDIVWEVDEWDEW